MPLRHERRQFFRLKYPPSERPRLFLGLDAWTVTELSEGGARVANDCQAAPQLDEIVSGAIFFKDGGYERLEGVVIRRMSDEWVVRLTPGVTLKRMMREQQRVLANYVQPRSL